MKVSEITKHLNEVTPVPVAPTAPTAPTGKVATTALQRVRKLSQPQVKALMAKSLPKLTLQGVFASIPIVNTIIGVAYVVPSLLKGDWVGAGLALGSMTAGNIPVVGTATGWSLAIAAVARELYNDIYSDMVGHDVTFEQDYAADPAGTRARAQELANEIYVELKALFQTNYPRLTGAQAQQNMRQAQTGMDTPANPDPRKHPELYPQSESVDRLVNLSKYKS
jgi:hypothetical protein